MSCNGEHCCCCVHHHQGSMRGWDEQCIEWVMGLLEKHRRGGKTEFFYCAGHAAQTVQACFYHLATAFTYICVRYQPCWPPTGTHSPDQAISPHQTSPSSPRCSPCSLNLVLITTFPTLKCELLSNIYQIVHSPLMSSAALMLFSCFSLHLFGLTYRLQFMSCWMLSQLRKGKGQMQMWWTVTTLTALTTIAWYHKFNDAQAINWTSFPTPWHILSHVYTWRIWPCHRLFLSKHSFTDTCQSLTCRLSKSELSLHPNPILTR